MFGLYNGLGGASRFIAAYDTVEEAIKDQDVIVGSVLNEKPDAWTEVNNSHESVRSVYLRAAAGRSLGYIAVRSILPTPRKD